MWVYQMVRSIAWALIKNLLLIFDMEKEKYLGFHLLATRTMELQIKVKQYNHNKHG